MTHTLFATLLALTSFGLAQTPLAPVGDPGRTYYAAFPVAVTLDGKPDDWAGIPKVVVTTGTQPAPEPAENGSLTFAAAADAENLYVLALVPDATIVTGTHPGEPWLEDSVEVYLNASGDLMATSYGRGVAQITVPAENIGRTPDASLISGNGGASVGAQAFVWRTANGYGVELAVPLTNSLWSVTPEHGLEVGFQMHLNGASSPSGRDVKLIWSDADTEDGSANNPSLFGRLVFHKVGTPTGE